MTNDLCDNKYFIQIIVSLEDKVQTEGFDSDEMDSDMFETIDLSYYY